MASRSDIQAGRASITLGLKNQDLLRGLANAKRQLQEFGASASAVGRGMMAIGGAALAPIGLAVKRFADFDDAMRQVQAVADATPEQFDALSAAARRLGETTSFSAAEVAGLMAELGRAGFDATQIDAATAAVLDMARAAGVDAATAAKVMGASLNQFGLGADQARRVADALALTANISATGVEDLGEALSYSGKVASDAGMSIEDTLAVLAGLGNVGVTGSSAGTALQRLLTITGAEAEKLKGIFGVAFTDAANNTRPLVEVLAEVAAVTKDMPTAERTAKMADAFGLLGITGAGAIGSAAGQIVDFQKQLKDAEGSSAKAAAKMDAGLGGAFRRIVNAVDSVALSIGQALSTELTSMIASVQAVATAINAWVKNNTQLVVMIAKIAAGLIAGGAAFVAFGSAVQAVGFAVGGIGTLISAVTTVVGGIAAVFTPVGLVIAGLAAYVVAATAAFFYFADPLKNLMPLLSAVSESVAQLWSAFSSGDVGSIFDAIAASASRMAFAVIESIGGMIESAKAKFWEILPVVQRVFSAMLSLAGDVFSQLPQLAGYAIGAAARVMVKGIVAVKTWIVETISSLATAIIDTFKNLGAKLVKAMLTGDFRSIGEAVSAALNASVARSAVFGASIASGLMGQTAPGFELSDRTRAAFAEVSPATKATPQTTPAATPQEKAVADAVAETGTGAASAEALAKKLAEARKELIDSTPIEQYKERLGDLNHGLEIGAINAREWKDEVAKAQQEFLGVDPPPLDVYAARVRELHQAFQQGAISGEQFADELRATKRETFDLDASPLDQFRERVSVLDQAFYAGAISLDQYRERLAESKAEILGIETSPMQQFAARAEELREQLQAGAITQKEYSHAFAESQRNFLGLDANPIDEYRRKLDELRKALSQGLITPQQFQAASMEALPDKVKSIIEETRTPMEKFREEMAELNDVRSSGLIDQTTYDRRKQQLQAEAGGQNLQTTGSFSAAALAVTGRGQGGGSPQERMQAAVEEQAKAAKVAAEANANSSKDLKETMAALREYLKHMRYG